MGRPLLNPEARPGREAVTCPGQAPRLSCREVPALAFDEGSDPKHGRRNKLKEARRTPVAHLRDYHPTLDERWMDFVKACGAEIPAPNDMGTSWRAHQLTPFPTKVQGSEIPEDGSPEGAPWDGKRWAAAMVAGHLLRSPKQKDARAAHHLSLASSKGPSPFRHGPPALASFIASLDPGALAAASITTLAAPTVKADIDGTEVGGGEALPAALRDATPPWQHDRAVRRVFDGLVDPVDGGRMHKELMGNVELDKITTCSEFLDAWRRCGCDADDVNRRHELQAGGDSSVGAASRLRESAAWISQDPKRAGGAVAALLATGAVCVLFRRWRQKKGGGFKHIKTKEPRREEPDSVPPKIVGAAMNDSPVGGPDVFAIAGDNDDDDDDFALWEDEALAEHLKNQLEVDAGPPFGDGGLRLAAQPRGGGGGRSQDVLPGPGASENFANFSEPNPFASSDGLDLFAGRA
ncbi:unnamed protein product [Prorocentrum cordatum]|uniref:Condensin complex subunit 2 n=1 Tax=Prorocentrum cordatum TaxID=2364126 RepID=A0ABN9SXY9_9DINO|nr:unnamed protein product [Polarella glacialis]